MAKSPKTPTVNSRGLLLFTIAFALIAGAFVFRGSKLNQVQDLSYQQFSQLLKAGKIVSSPETPVFIIVEAGSPTQTLTGYFRQEPGESLPNQQTLGQSSESTITNTPEEPKTDLVKSIQDAPREPENSQTQEESPNPLIPEPITGEGLGMGIGTSRLVAFRTPIFMDYNGEELKKELAAYGITPSIHLESNLGFNLLFGMLPFAIFLILLYFLFTAQMRASNRGHLGFGKSKAKMLSKDNNKVTFKDVAGVEEAKEEVSELVDFLKDPKKFQKLGGRIPKGVLMVGSPGTGKTLLAKAIAGEADVPFFSISGSDFVEMFVGVGASRVRDMFEQGKKNAPCIIFIDEIDAVGRHRGGGMGGGHDEREQTLNALLVEMDGFEGQEGVIIIAATNRPDVLDPALLRPGRFDRQVTVGLPDVKGRLEILKVHTKKVKLSDSVDLEVIARGTPGYSGAELANVVNEAALLSARKGLLAIGTEELEEARDKVRWGKERRSLTIGDKEKEITAYHEAGHALLLEMLEHTEPLHKVTIIPRGPSLGSTMWLPKTDRYNTRKNELLDHLVVIMGGRVAEEIVFKDITSGASGDIKQATGIARKMVCQWGMSESLGMIEYGEGGEHLFLAKDFNKIRDYSEATAQAIDKEVKTLIDNAYSRAKNLLEENRTKLDLIAQALLEYETLEGHQIQDIIKLGVMGKPPKSQNPPKLPENLSRENSDIKSPEREPKPQKGKKSPK